MAIAILLGMTRSKHPLTPDLAGNPTYRLMAQIKLSILFIFTEKANSPDELYIPQLNIKDKTCRITSGFRTFSSLMGHVPPLAKVAPITDKDSQSTSKEQVCNIKNIKMNNNIYLKKH